MRLWTIEHKGTAPAPKPTPAAADDHDALIDLAFAALSPLAGPVVETVCPTRYDVLYPAEG